MRHRLASRRSENQEFSKVYTAEQKPAGDCTWGLTRGLTVTCHGSALSLSNQRSQMVPDPEPAAANGTLVDGSTAALASTAISSGALLISFFSRKAIKLTRPSSKRVGRTFAAENKQVDRKTFKNMAFCSTPGTSSPSGPSVYSCPSWKYASGAAG